MQVHFQHITRLIIALGVSGGLNIALLTLIFYWMVVDRPPTPYCELKPAVKEQQQPSLAEDLTNSEIIRRFRTYSMEQLIFKLASPRLVESGYTERDLALSCLIAFHHFDQTRAFAETHQSIQKRSIVYGQRPNGTPAEIIVYPGLSNSQYESILQFAKTERWPQTSKGLFLLLQKQKVFLDPSLVDAFILTPEFLAIETLFSRSENPVEKQELIRLLIEGEWKMAADFKEQQRVSQDLSPARRQRILLDYIEHGSKMAAFLMLKIESTFAVKKLDDSHVLSILKLLEDKTSEGDKFALALLESPRSDAVWKLAATRLYQYAGEEKPDNYQHQAALLRFLPAAAIKNTMKGMEKPQVIPEMNKELSIISKPIISKPIKQVVTSAPLAKKDRLYLVQGGDNLWRISRRFNIDVKVLKKYNKLDSDSLKPGTALRIPLGVAQE